MTIGTPTTLVGLLNAMIGGSMLVIPVLAIDAGYLSWTLNCILICAVTGYTAYLLITHLGKAKNIKYLILAHFKQDHTYTTLYNVVIWFSFLSAMLIYFNLFCAQIQGILGRTSFIPEILVVVLIIWIVCLRQCDLSEVALASGITSIIGFLVFVGWAQATAPEGEKVIQPIESNPSALTLAFLNCYTTHDFLIQVIVNNPKRKDYPKIVFLLYFVGMFAFLYTAYGALALVNRQSVKSHPESIVDFFEGGAQQGWQITILELLYVVHVLTTFPQYVLISKIRIFQLMDIEHSQKNDISIGEIIYITIVVSICYTVYKFQISLSLIIDVSGSVIGYLFAVLIPIWIHLKCLYYDKSSGFIQNDEDRNMEIVLNDCQCNITYRSKYTLYAETAVLIFFVLFGLFYFMRALVQDLIIDESKG